MSRNFKKVFTTLNYIEHFLILAFKILDVSQVLPLLLCFVFLYELRIPQYD